MSDGPYKSLPMQRWWREVAKAAENEAFEIGEISTRIIVAVDEDCHRNNLASFVSYIQDVLNKDDLLSGDIVNTLEGLRTIVAGYPAGNVLLDHIIYLLRDGHSRTSTIEEGVTYMLQDWSARHARQIEEHYLRESNIQISNKVSARIHQAIQKAPFVDLTNRQLDKGKNPTLRLKKQVALDDGVRL